MTGLQKKLSILCLIVFTATPIIAQTLASKPHAASLRHQTIIHFSGEKVILGMPTGGHTVAHCSNDGTTFLDQYTDESGSVPELFSIEQDGTLTHLSRKLPPDFTSISMLDFFAGDHTLVTLLKAELDNDIAGSITSREVDYFLSLSDHDGDGAELVPLELRFTPLKIALFGSGDFLVLGWDEANLQPLLAVLKSDGTIRRFVDLSDRLHSEFFASYNSMKETESHSKERASAVSLLQRVQFVPYGKRVLLTYPGTARSILVLSPVGQDSVIPIAIPAGFVLHDALVSNDTYSLVLRVQPAEGPTKPAASGTATASLQRLFEMNSYHGEFIRELLLDKPHVDQVTCAANYKLTAIFTDTVNGQAPSVAGVDGQPVAAEAATQAVIATAAR